MNEQPKTPTHAHLSGNSTTASTCSLQGLAKPRVHAFCVALTVFIAFALSPSSFAAGYTQISAGHYHTCAVVSTGEVHCWGANDVGALGDGSTTWSGVPVQVQGITEAVSVSVGTYATCALLASGRVRCWGGGALGDGAGVSSPTPVTVVGISTATSISVGNGHACVVLSSGGVRCWGNGFGGKLGNGSTSNSDAPVVVSTISTAIAVAAGGQHTCAVLVNQTVQCWGYNSDDQLGYSGSESSTPVLVAGLTGVTAIGAGSSHSCAQLGSLRVRCWGRNGVGQLGNGNTGGTSASPVTVIGPANVMSLFPPLTDVSAISLGQSHSCALLTSGAPRCWGDGSSGQLGVGNRSNLNRAFPVANIGSPTQISAGLNHTCAVFSSGAAQCWGSDFWLQLGIGRIRDGGPVLRPSEVVGVSGAVRLAASRSSACVTLIDGTIKCWGNNLSGELGNNSTVSSSVPVSAIGVISATAIGGGGNHMCAVRTAAAAISAGFSAQCWGDNSGGQLGNGSTTPSLTPVAVSGTSIIYAAIDGGNAHTCALQDSGRVRCWGDNSSGQLGDNNAPNNSRLPVLVSGITSAAGIGVGGNHACAVLASVGGGGGVQCWGSNTSGQIGDNSTGGTRPVPTSVFGITTAVGVALGSSFSCARLSSGGVRCWGSNLSGQLGNNSTTSSDNPVTVTGITAATAISAGALHACAVVAGGQVYCWGAGASGQLGNYGTAGSPIPVRVTGIDNAVSVVAGGEFSCALLNDGMVRCWGNNMSGQIGDGRESIQTTPLQWVVADRCTLDVDGDGVVSANTDGLMLVRAMLGFSGTAVTGGAVGANAARPGWQQIRTHLSMSCGLQGLAQ